MPKRLLKNPEDLGFKNLVAKTLSPDTSWHCVISQSPYLKGGRGLVAQLQTRGDGKGLADSGPQPWEAKDLIGARGLRRHLWRR